MVGLELAQDRWQQVHKHGHAGADAHPLEPSISELAHGRLRARIVVQQMSSKLDQFLAGLSWVGALAEPFQERALTIALIPP
jgi:hypothetical protein